MSGPPYRRDGVTVAHQTLDLEAGVRILLAPGLFHWQPHFHGLVKKRLCPRRARGKVGAMKQIGYLVYILYSVAAAMVGYQIHHSIFWSIVDFVFPIFATAKWLICHQVTASVIKATFSFLAS